MTSNTHVDRRPAVDEPAAASGGSHPGMLRAMGQLLVALAGQETIEPPLAQLHAASGVAEALAARARAAVDQQSRHEESTMSTDAPARTREPFAVPSLPPTPTDDDIHLMLADARARAHQLIDESVVKAHDLLSRQRPATSVELARHGEQLERIRRAVAEVGVELRAIHKRLDTIESMLRSRADAPALTTPAAAPTVARSLEDDRQPIAPGTSPAPSAALEASASEPAPPSAATPDAAPLPIAGSEAPRPTGNAPSEIDRLEKPAASAVTTQASGMNGAAASPADGAGEALSRAENAQTHAEPSAVSVAAGSEEPFAATGAPVTLRVSPISGFQGLMRVQDTIVRLPEVREAGVEAYARGEARLRVEISAPISPTRLAAALAEGLGQSARITGASTKERSVEVSLRERPRAG